jgi:hypothetical protein
MIRFGIRFLNVDSVVRKMMAIILYTDVFIIDDLKNNLKYF